MKASLRDGLVFEFKYTVPESKTVPHVYPESELFRSMPAVFATAYMIGLVEWACMEALQPHLDPGEQSVGTDVRISHTAATPPGLTITVEVKVEKVLGRRVGFSVALHDGIEAIGGGTHERFIIDPSRFTARVKEKAVRAAR